MKRCLGFPKYSAQRSCERTKSSLSIGLSKSTVTVQIVLTRPVISELSYTSIPACVLQNQFHCIVQTLLGNILWSLNSNHSLDTMSVAVSILRSCIKSLKQLCPLLDKRRSWKLWWYYKESFSYLAYEKKDLWGSEVLPTIKTSPLARAVIFRIWDRLLKMLM